MSFWSKVMINKYFLHQKSSLIYNDILLFTLLFYLNNLFFLSILNFISCGVFLFVFLILIFSKLKGKFILKKYYFLKEKRNEEIYFFFKYLID